MSEQDTIPPEDLFASGLRVTAGQQKAVASFVAQLNLKSRAYSRFLADSVNQDVASAFNPGETSRRIGVWRIGVVVLVHTQDVRMFLMFSPDGLTNPSPSSCRSSKTGDAWRQVRKYAMRSCWLPGM